MLLAFRDLGMPGTRLIRPSEGEKWEGSCARVKARQDVHLGCPEPSPTAMYILRIWDIAITKDWEILTENDAIHEGNFCFCLFDASLVPCVCPLSSKHLFGAFLSHRTCITQIEHLECCFTQKYLRLSLLPCVFAACLKPITLLSVLQLTTTHHQQFLQSAKSLEVACSVEPASPRPRL